MKQLTLFAMLLGLLTACGSNKDEEIFKGVFFNGVSSSTNASVDLDKGLVLSMPFNGNAQDISGNANHGTVNGATLTTDRKGVARSAYSFNGINNWIKVSDNPTLRPATITIAAWINRAVIQPSNPAAIFYKGEYEIYALGVNNFSIKQNSGCLSYTGTGWQSATNIAPIQNVNQWYFIVGIFDGKSLLFYQDGKLIFQRTNLPATKIDNCAGGDFRIGRWHNLSNDFFSGKIDDLRVYNRVLSDSEVQALYRQ